MQPKWQLRPVSQCSISATEGFGKEWGRERLNRPRVIYNRLLSLDTRRLSDNNKGRVESKSHLFESLRQGFFLGALLNESVISVGKLRKPDPVRTCPWPFGNHFRADGLFTREITHQTIRQADPSGTSGTAQLTGLPLKAWMSPHCNDFYWGPPLPSPPLHMNSCYCPETSPQKCGPCTIFTANENGYT